jgi:hypothetical protein
MSENQWVRRPFNIFWPVVQAVEGLGLVRSGLPTPWFQSKTKMISFLRERERERERVDDQDQNPSATIPTVYDVLCFHFRKCFQGAKVLISRTNHTLKHEILQIKTLTPIVHLSCNLSMQSVFTIEPKQFNIYLY